eukprot:scaffold41385_cov69-Phaeocystis_antarctica.AAC.1
MPIAEGLAPRLQRLAVQRLSGGEVAALGVQQRAEESNGVERVRMPVAEGLALHLQRLADQRLSGGEVALGVQQRAEVADGGQRVRMPVAERLACHLQRLTEQRLSGGVVAPVLQQGTERLTVQRLGLVVLALGLQLQSEPIQGEVCCLAIRALGLEPCTQKLEAQRIAVLVHALAAAVGCILLWARAPPLLEAVSVDPLDGAAAGARLDERPVPARLLLHYHVCYGCRRSVTTTARCALCRPCWSGTERPPCAPAARTWLVVTSAHAPCWAERWQSAVVGSSEAVKYAAKSTAPAPTVPAPTVLGRQGVFRFASLGPRRMEPSAEHAEPASPSVDPAAPARPRYRIGKKKPTAVPDAPSPAEPAPPAAEAPPASEPTTEPAPPAPTEHRTS